MASLAHLPTDAPMAPVNIPVEFEFATPTTFDVPYATMSSHVTTMQKTPMNSTEGHRARDRGAGRLGLLAEDGRGLEADVGDVGDHSEQHGHANSARTERSPTERGSREPLRSPVNAYCRVENQNHADLEDRDRRQDFRGQVDPEVTEDSDHGDQDQRIQPPAQPRGRARWCAQGRRPRCRRRW